MLIIQLPSVTEFQGVLIERVKRTPTIESFRFKPDREISFLAGQFLSVMFDPENKNNRELNKYLSFSSSPHKDYIEVTKRLSGSAFSRRLMELRQGEGVSFRGPLGNCVFKPEYEKIGFLIGGIGITPVISMLEYIAEKGLDTDVVLLYSNRNPQEIAFKTELDKWKSEGKHINVIYGITDSNPQDKECFYGRISSELVRGRITDISQRRFFIFGPPLMVDSMKQICLEAGCEKETIVTESFTGY